MTCPGDILSFYRFEQLISWVPPRLAGAEGRVLWHQRSHRQLWLWRGGIRGNDHDDHGVSRDETCETNVCQNGCRPQVAGHQCSTTWDEEHFFRFISTYSNLSCPPLPRMPVTTRMFLSRWWFQILFMFTPIWGRFPFE